MDEMETTLRGFLIGFCIVTAFIYLFAEKSDPFDFRMGLGIGLCLGTAISWLLTRYKSD